MNQSVDLSYTNIPLKVGHILALVIIYDNIFSVLWKSILSGKRVVFTRPNIR
jgi:hypothetical protein